MDHEFLSSRTETADPVEAWKGESMRIILAGGTGFLGSPLVETLVAAHHDVAILSRRHQVELPAGARTLSWDGASSGAWSREVDGSDAVINLAGEPISARRWSPQQRQKILMSRIDATRALVEAIRGAKKRPSVLVNGSAVGYYGDVPEGTVTEDHPRGTGFLADTCEFWEHEALKAQDLGVRVAVMRTGIVLGEKGGALPRLLLPFRLFAGGTLGSGLQWFPWIHRDDVVGAIVHVLQTPGVHGPVNTTGPEPVTMRQFCLVLGNVLQRPSWIRVPAFLLRIMMGEMSDLVLTGQRAIPSKLLASGYKFRYSNVLEALEVLSL
jgi:uncharacterized protein (TIGR01777 family)